MGTGTTDSYTVLFVGSVRGVEETEVDRHGGFADAAFATGNADDFGGFKLAHAIPLCAAPPIG